MPLQSRSYRPIGLAIVAIISLASLSMPWLLQAGLPLQATLDQRMDYVTRHSGLWHLGWGLWMASALGLLLFIHILSRFCAASLARSYALALVTVGVAADLIAELLLSQMLPWLAAQSALYSAQSYAAVEHVALLLTGFLANALYNLGGLLLTFALLRNKALPRALLIFALPAWLIGLGLSGATVLGAMDLAYWCTAISMGWSLLWMTLVSLVVLPKVDTLAVSQ